MPRTLSRRTDFAGHGARSSPLGRHGMTLRTQASSSGLTFCEQAWFDLQPELDPEYLVFIDKTGASTKLVRLNPPTPGSNEPDES